ncbi:MAG: hypothetical protein JWQ98_2849 [Chlorobi bacterium]|nr:hypothetical protein [Chlorobiota bacterium]
MRFMNRALSYPLFGMPAVVALLVAGCGSAASTGKTAAKDSIPATAPVTGSNPAPESRPGSENNPAAASPSANGVPPNSSAQVPASGSAADIPSNAPVQLPRGIDATAGGSGHLPSEGDYSTPPTGVDLTTWNELDHYMGWLGGVVDQAVSTKGRVPGSDLLRFRATAEELANDRSEGRRSSQSARTALLGTVIPLTGAGAAKSPAAQLRALRGVLQATRQVLMTSEPYIQPYVQEVQRRTSELDAVIAVVK